MPLGGGRLPLPLVAVAALVRRDGAPTCGALEALLSAAGAALASIPAQGVPAVGSTPATSLSIRR
jgi:hypothetical protein